MNAPRKDHVIVGRWQTGGFHVERYLECRCGMVLEHYNAGALRDQFKRHQDGLAIKHVRIVEPGRTA